MQRRQLIQSASLAALALSGVLSVTAVQAQDNKFKIGLILPMTGQSASTGRQIDAAARLYMAQNGDTVAGKKIELIVKDDTGLARRHRAPRAGTGGQRQGQRARGLRPDAAGARGGADRHAVEDAARS